MAVGERIQQAAALLGRRRRRAWFGARRAYLELRDLEAAELVLLRQCIQRQMSTLGGVEWVEVNPYTRRVVVAFTEGSCAPRALLERLDRAEHEAFCAAAEFQPHTRSHPADAEPLLKLSLELAVNLASTVVGTVLQASPVPASRVAGAAASVLMFVQSVSTLRGRLDERFGEERADLGIDFAVATGNAAAQRPIVSLVEVFHHLALWREARARRAVWFHREAALTARPSPELSQASLPQSRCCELPRGPVERYADRAWVIALSGFGFSLVTTRSLQRAVAALVAGMPKPARLGREVFCADLGRQLAQRQVIVLESDSLRRLDRIDCLVLADDIVARDRFEIVHLVVTDGIEEPWARRQLLSLFDADRPLETQGDGSVRLLPLGKGAVEDDSLSAAADELAQSGRLTLQLYDGERRIAVATVEIEPRMGLEELVDAAQKANLHVVVASDRAELLDSILPDEVILPAEGLSQGIERLQREGHVVCAVATGQSAALAVSDCGVGLVQTGSSPPWGAHLLCRDDLTDVRFLVESSVVARQVSRQSVNIAMAAATMGALVSATGLARLTSRRVMTVVNAATLIAILNGHRAARSLAKQPDLVVRDRTCWHALDARGVMHRLGTSEIGLSELEVMRRRGAPPPRKRPSAELVEAIADELFNPLAPLLAAGAGLSAVAGSMGDAAMVGAVVLFNAVVGGVQRFRTEQRIRDLAATARKQATVHRDGKIRSVDAEELVPGDIVVLTSGDVVPADCRILHAEAVEVDTSSLTGESMPVRRSELPSFDLAIADRASMLYSGTTVAAGRTSAIVVAVGDQTEAARGGIALRRAQPPSGVEQRLRSLINLTAPVALGAGLGLVGAGLLRGRRVEHLVPAGVSLAVAAVPEGLPLLATAAQLAAASRLSKRGALVRDTKCIEALGRIDLVCFDKTGTLTEGHLDLAGVTRGLSLVGEDDLDERERGLLMTALHAAPDPRYVTAHDDPTDRALLEAVERSAPGVVRLTGERLAELPFEPGRGYQSVLWQQGADRWVVIKGAPEVVLEQADSWDTGIRCEPLDPARRGALRAFVETLAGQGFRLLGVARRTLRMDEADTLPVPGGLTLLGYIAFSDPVRSTAEAALARLRTVGVDSRMITGDHPKTAEAVAAAIGLLSDRRVLTGAELLEMSDGELDEVVDSAAVFARVTPSQKARIIRSLQRVGHVVAMVGDGTNDAPALRVAQVGIAVGEQSTAAARGAADVVLTDERIQTLVEAIIEGRAMWSSVRDAVAILIGGNLGEIGFTLLGGLAAGSPPLNPRQLLLVNLLTDVAPAMAIALRPPSVAELKTLASEGPDVSLGRPLNRDIASRAMITALGAGLAWSTARVLGGGERAGTVGLLALVGTQLGQTIVAGGTSRPVIVTSLASTALLAAVVQTPVLSQFFGCQPLTPLGWSVAVSSTAIATGVAIAFPQLTSALAVRLRPIDTVLREAPRGSVVPPPPSSVRRPSLFPV